MIEGVGLFALTNILAGTKLYISEQLSNEFHAPEEFETLEEYQKKFVLERFPVYKETGWIHPNSDYMLSFVNHSEQGNYSPVYDVAIVDIKEGEEITFDYGEHNPTR